MTTTFDLRHVAHVARLNSRAICLYQEGCVAEARDLFLDALQWLQYISCQSPREQLVEQNKKTTSVMSSNISAEDAKRDAYNSNQTSIQNTFAGSASAEHKRSNIYDDHCYRSSTDNDTSSRSLTINSTSCNDDTLLQESASIADGMLDGSTMIDHIAMTVDTDTYSITPANDPVDCFCHVIYNGAFPLAYDIPLAPSETSGVLLFNLALMLHHIGLAECKESSRVDQTQKTIPDSSLGLEKALHVYIQSFNVMDVQGQPPNSAVLMILKAAVCNNMAQIYTTLAQMRRACTMYAYLAETTMLMQKYHSLQLDSFGRNIAVTQEGTTDRTAFAKDLEFFYGSLFFANIHGFRLAPAA